MRLTEDTGIRESLEITAKIRQNRNASVNKIFWALFMLSCCYTPVMAMYVQYVMGRVASFPM